MWHDRSDESDTCPTAKRPCTGFLKSTDTVAFLVLPCGGGVDTVTSICAPASVLPPVLFAALNAHMDRCTGYEREPDGSRSLIVDQNLYLLSWDLRDEIILQATKTDDIIDSERTKDDIGDDACALLVAECKRLFHDPNPQITQLALSGSSFAAPSLTIRVEVPAVGL